jgi:hypothetical protein
MDKIPWNLGNLQDNTTHSSMEWATSHCCVQHVIQSAGYPIGAIPTLNDIISYLKISKNQVLSIKNIRKILEKYNISLKTFYISSTQLKDPDVRLDWLYEIKKYLVIYKLPVIVSKQHQSFCITDVSDDLDRIHFFDPHTLFDNPPQTAEAYDFFLNSSWIACCAF